MSLQIRFGREFAQTVGGTYGIPFWKARVALYAVLKALGIGKGDEVIVPGYTCVMDVNPIMYVGARPRYADIDPETFNASPESVRSLVNENTKMILCQHTYGIPADVDKLHRIAADCGAWLIEDCCLSLGSRVNGRPVGTFGDGAYWSFQWNKIFTTGLGGMVTTDRSDLAQALENISEEEAEYPGRVAASVLTAQRVAHRAIIWPRTVAVARVVFRKLSRMGLAVGSSDATEFCPQMPEGFLKKMSHGQARAGLSQLRKLSENLQHRRRIAQFYNRLLWEAGWETLRLAPGMDPVLVGYPVRVADKRKVLAEAPASLIELSSWFESPLHPEETPLEPYGYQCGMCPHAEQACREVVLLPTHPRSTERDAERVVRFLIERTRQVKE